MEKQPFSLSSGQMEWMIQMLSARLGVQPDLVRSMVQSGNAQGLSSLASQLGGSSAQQLQQILSDPAQVQALLASDQARSLRQNKNKQ